MASLWGAAGESRYLPSWLGLESVLWLVLALLVMACVVGVVRAGEMLGFPTWLSHVAAPLVVGLAVLQGMWVTSMFASDLPQVLRQDWCSHLVWRPYSACAGTRFKLST